MGILITALLSLITSGEIPTAASLYPETAIVTDVNETEDCVIVECSNGNLFQFYGIEDWAEGDICSMLMSDNGTTEVTDDQILSVKYSGYVEGR